MFKTFNNNYQIDVEVKIQVWQLHCMLHIPGTPLLFYALKDRFNN